MKIKEIKNIAVLIIKSRLNMLELNCYRLCGSFKECREATNKQKPIEPKLHMNEPENIFIVYENNEMVCREEHKNNWHCPKCDNIVGQRIVIGKHIHDQNKKKYCDKCGQAILWEWI